MLRSSTISLVPPVRRRFAAALAALVLPHAVHAAAPSAATRTAVIEAVELVDDAPGARLEIAVDRPLVWSVGRDAAGNLALELPNARPGWGVVSRVVAGGLVAEIRLASVGVPSRPVTRVVVITRGVADHRLAVDGGRLRLELAPTGHAFPGPPEAAQTVPPADAAPAVVPPDAAAPTPEPAPIPAPVAIEAEREPEIEELDLPPAAEVAASSPEPSPELAVAPVPSLSLPPAAAPAPEPVPSQPPLVWRSPELAAQPVAALPREPPEVPSEIDPQPQTPNALRLVPPVLSPRPVDSLPTAPGAAPETVSSPSVADLRLVQDAAPPVEPSPAVPPPLREVATELTSVAHLAAGVLAVAGDGAFDFTGFRLENPERFVLDLHGVLNRSPSGSIEIDEGLLVRVRVSQYRVQPTPVTRVIFDLRAPTVPAIEPAADGLLVRFPEHAALPVLPR